jgi:hypothetical protein
LFHEDKAFLKDAKARIGLSGFAYRTMDGFTFPGWRLFPDRRRLVRINVVRFNRRMKAMWKEHEAGTLEWDKIVGRVRAWDAHAAHGDPWRLREQIYDRFLFPPARSRKEGDLKIFFSGRLSRPLEIGHLRHRVVSLAEGAGLTKISLDIPEVFL